MGAKLLVETFTVGAFQENCYLLVDDRTNSAVIVDPGSEGERLVEAIDKSGAKLEAIWITHAHVDHVGAIASVKKRWDVPIYLHPLDRRLYEIGLHASARGKIQKSAAGRCCVLYNIN